MSEGFSLLIDVSADDIANGVRRNICLCPIAIATRRSDPELTGVVVDSEIRLNRGGNRFYTKLPSEAVDFVAFFDWDIDHTGVSPFSFTAHFVPDERDEEREEDIDE